MSEGSISAAGLSKAKSRAVLNVAEWFATQGTVARRLTQLPDEEVVGTLTTIGGIGAWTANVFLIFNLGRLTSCLPAISAFSAAYSSSTGSTVPRQRDRSMTKPRWRPYRSIASIYLWNAVKLKITVDDLEMRGHLDHRV